MAPIQRMARKSSLFMLAAALLISSPIAGAEPPLATENAGTEIPSAAALFQKLQESVQTLDFEGKLTFMSQGFGNQPLEARVLRKAPDKLRIELISPSEVGGTAMVMSGKERWHIPGGGDRRRPPFPPLHPDRIGGLLLRNARLLLQNYDVRVLNGGHVADRSTYLLEVDSKVSGRPSMKIWVDAEMGMILKIEQYDSQKRPRGFLVYSEINFEPEIDESDFQRQNAREDDREPRREMDRGRREIWNHNQGELNLEEIRKAARLDVILPDETPERFILQNIHIVEFGERRNVHLTYTDGLAIVSVFESLSDERTRGGEAGPRLRGRENRREDAPPWRRGRPERININGIECEVMSRGPMFIFRWNYKDIYFTLMGELERKDMVGFVSSFIGKGE